MFRSRWSLPIVALGGVLLGIVLTRASEPFAKAKVQNLLREPLAEEFTPDREVLIDLVEMPPHTTLERHWHPGEEFHYYLEGEVELAMDSEKPILSKAGATSHVLYKRLHTAITKDVGAKILVFRVHKKGEPMRYLESESQSDPKQD